MSKKQKNSHKFQPPSPIEEWGGEQEWEESGERETPQPRAQKSIESVRPSRASSSAAAWILLIALVIFAASALIR